MAAFEINKVEIRDDVAYIGWTVGDVVPWAAKPLL